MKGEGKRVIRRAFREFGSLLTKALCAIPDEASVVGVEQHCSWHRARIPPRDTARASGPLRFWRTTGAREST